MSVKSTISIKLFEDVDLEGKYLITGFHGIGIVGYISLKYIITQTNARRIGIIVSNLMPPFVSLDENGELLLPFELYLDEINNLVFLIVRFQTHPDEMREFTKELVNFVVKNNMKGLVLLGGLDQEWKPADDEKGYRCIVTNGFPVKEEKPPLIEPKLFISGGIAMLLIELQMQKVPALTLFPYADKEGFDVQAAKKAVELLNEQFELTIPTDKLGEESEKMELEKEVNQILKQDKQNANDNIYM
ncbi:MAG TPA: PAC2 family protein [Candidatus Lokiarchaeia archaeon]|nr:PAC2 family protein [Candidatus Lokiarchaeia archaeon]